MQSATTVGTPGANWVTRGGGLHHRYSLVA
jgi:hypothetical protein